MSRTILIVEDDEEIHQLYSMMLEEMDCRIIRAYDGGEALRKLEEVTPDVIILDVILDEVMGDTFFLHLKQKARHADIPVIVASVLPAEAIQNLLAKDPRTVYLPKPFQKEHLLEMVERALG